MMQWNGKRRVMTKFYVLTNEMMVTENPAETGQATGVAANPTDITRPRRMYYVDAPINDDQPYVRQDDAELISGRVLQATANYNIADDLASCVGGQPQKVHLGLDKNVLEVKKAI